MHNRDQFDQEMRRFEEREELSGPMTGSGGSFMNKQKVVKYAFMALLGFEAMLCWNWLIQPLMPVITNIINNKGALSLSAGAWQFFYRWNERTVSNVVICRFAI